MSSSGFSNRHAFSRTLLEEARTNPAIYAVTSDARNSVTIQDFAAALPGQFVEVGIAEQDAVGIAAGLAIVGKRVFVCGPASFYSARSLEQVKNDVAYAGSDVKVIGVSGGVSYGALGGTHHSLHDLAVMRTFPGLRVFLPCDAYQTAAITRLMASNPWPCYMRTGRDPSAEVYPAGWKGSFEAGAAVMLRDGADGTIVAAGETVQSALGAADILASRGIGVRVLDCWSIKPFDRGAIEAAARETGLIVTVEEHSVFGGLGAAVAEAVVQSTPVPVKIIGFPDEWAPAGNARELFDYYGLSAGKLAESVESAIREKTAKRGAGTGISGVSSGAGAGNARSGTGPGAEGGFSR